MCGNRKPASNGLWESELLFFQWAALLAACFRVTIRWNHHWTPLSTLSQLCGAPCSWEKWVWFLWMRAQWHFWWPSQFSALQHHVSFVFPVAKQELSWVHFSTGWRCKHQNVLSCTKQHHEISWLVNGCIVHREHLVHCHGNSCKTKEAEWWRTEKHHLWHTPFTTGACVWPELVIAANAKNGMCVSILSVNTFSSLRLSEWSKDHLSNLEFFTLFFGTETIPKVIPLSQSHLHNTQSGQRIPTPKDLLSLQQHTGFEAHMWLPLTHMRDRCMWLTSTVVEDHTMTLASTPSNHQTPLFLPFSTFTQHTLAWCYNPSITRAGFMVWMWMTTTASEKVASHVWLNLSFFTHCPTLNKTQQP